jgi:hypothetical protein
VRARNWVVATNTTARPLKRSAARPATGSFEKASVTDDEGRCMNTLRLR